MFPTPGPLELIIVLVIALLVLGPGKLPDVGSALGKSLREFRKAAGDIQEATKIDTSPLGSEPAAPAASIQPAALVPVPVAGAPTAAPIQPPAAAPAPAPPAPAASVPAAPADAMPVAPVAVAPVAAAPSSADVPGGAGLSVSPPVAPSDQPRPESLS